jgi:hypothetical protein
MRLRCSSRPLIGALVGALVLAAGPASSQFTPFDHDAATILEGNWQSCREPDGRFTERVSDHVVNGVGRFEVHMGPRATQRWEVPSLGVALTVTLAGGSRTECESWFVVLEPLKKPSH